jgi:hypothetical protein
MEKMVLMQCLSLIFSISLDGTNSIDNPMATGDARLLHTSLDSDIQKKVFATTNR